MTSSPEPPEIETSSTGSTRENIRGSSLLMAGRLIAVSINFVVHVIIVRYLTQADYGAYAYAVSAVAVGSHIAVLGMDKTMSRFVPIYEEQADDGRVRGALGVGLATIGALSFTMTLALVLSLFLAPQIWSDEGRTRDVLLILALMLPVQAYDSALISLFAMFGGAKHIFWRRYVVGPLLVLGITLAAIQLQLDVVEYAAATAAAAFVGLAVYAVVLGRLVRPRVRPRARSTPLRFPAREMLTYSLPLMSADIVYQLRTSIVVVLLGSIAGVTEVALYSAVLPIANQNSLIPDSFRTLYIPAASRLFARGDDEAVNDLYWQTGTWVAVALLPILLLSASFARPVTELVLGPEYVEASAVLTVLALAMYVAGVLGHSGLTLRVYGRVRYLVAVDVITLVVGTLVAIALISVLGATGAAVGVAIMIILQQTLYQIGLARTTPVAAIARHHMPVHGAIVLIAALLLMVDLIAKPPLWVGLVLTVAASGVMVIVTRRFLRLTDTFPELRRIPIVGRWLE